MHQTVGKAITELRRVMNWSQEELAHELDKHAKQKRTLQEPTAKMVSKWEAGTHSPAPEHRVTLARLAKGQKATEDLVPIFLASTTGWNLVARVKLLEEKH
jgi:transcriptional regulator with XRE-family HTH domain